MARSRRPKYKQGIYKPRNKAKCINTQSGKKVEYRSQLEFEYMYKLDYSNRITKWGSEVVWIPYYNPIKKRVCQYWTDLVVHSKEHGVLIVEIKPEKEITAILENKIPKRTGRKKESTLMYELKMFAINQAKWRAAKEYCDTKGWKFVLVSEKNIKDGNVPFL